ncbi:hypothetical protein Droror1_Dr00008308 [Drosera rotundifolia]
MKGGSSENRTGQTSTQGVQSRLPLKLSCALHGLPPPSGLRSSPLDLAGNTPQVGDNNPATSNRGETKGGAAQLDSGSTGPAAARTAQTRPNSDRTGPILAQ